MRARMLSAVVAGATASLLIVAGAVAAKPAPPRPYQPGDHVWSSNPPSPDGVATTSEPSKLGTLPAAPLPAPVRPYRVGDKVWLTTPPSVQLPLATGCQRVPATGYIGQGVFSQTTFEYTNYWSWSDSSSGQSFTWYIKKTDGSTQAYASSFGGPNGCASSDYTAIYGLDVYNASHAINTGSSGVYVNVRIDATT